MSASTTLEGFGVVLIRSARDAERVACRWMLQNGYPDARVTPLGPDGGVDVRANGVVAQVKAEVSPVGAAPVQQLAGIAAMEEKRAFFFALGGYTRSAFGFAKRAGVALFRFDLQSEVEPANEMASSLSAWTIRRTVDERLSAAAASVGITGRVSQRVPALEDGLRAHVPRLAVWIDQVADVAEEMLGARTFSLEWQADRGFALDLAGNQFLVCYVDISAALAGGTSPVVALYVHGQLLNQLGGIEGIMDGTTLILPASDRDRLTRLCLGTLVEATNKCGARPAHLRVLRGRMGGGQSLARTVRRGESGPVPPLVLVESADSEPFEHLIGVVSHRSLTALVVSDDVQWRRPRLEFHRRSERVVVRVIASTEWDYRTPGPRALRAALLAWLPHATVQCPAPTRLHLDPPEDVIIARAAIQISDVPLAATIITEALTLDPGEFVLA